MLAGPTRVGAGLHCNGVMPHAIRPPRPARAVHLPRSIGHSLKFIVIALVVAGLYFGRDILVPLALAALLGFVLDPLISRLCRLGLRRGLAVGVVTSGTLSLLVGIGLLVGLQMVQLSSDLPRYQQTIEQKMHALRQGMSRTGSLDAASRLVLSLEHELEATRQTLERGGAAEAARKATPVRVINNVSPLNEVTAWVGPVLDRLLTGGIAAVLLVFILLERHELCDRILRMAGPNLRPMTDALNEAARRVSALLSMQVLVNAGFGVALGGGLWLLGIPGSLLWGTLAAMLRFVPYLGPMLAAAFPLLLATAIDPGWTLLAWTAGLIFSLEMILNNVVEPWLYGSSAGLATVAMLLSAAFWTALWGPVGLILATPLSVCLVVLGRHLPPFRFLDVLFGSDPVFDARTRLYRRLAGGHAGEAQVLARKETEERGLATFYGSSAIPALGEVSGARASLWSEEQRRRVHAGMASVLNSLREVHPLGASTAGDHARPTPPVCCVGLSGPADGLSAAMLAHALSGSGTPARALTAEALLAEWPPEGAAVELPRVCIVSYHPAPQRALRQLARRLHRTAPAVEILAGLWERDGDPPVATQSLKGEVAAVFHTLADGLSLMVRTDARAETSGAAPQTPSSPDRGHRSQGSARPERDHAAGPSDLGALLGGAAVTP